MTLFQAVGMWSLRTLIVWGAFETCVQGYERSLRHWSDWQTILSHDAAAARLTEQARTSEAAAADLEAATAPSSVFTVVPAPGESPARAAARHIREALLHLGAEAPMVEVVHEDDRRATFNVRWNERLEGNGGGILFALSAQSPALEVNTLSMQRGGQIEIAIEMSAPLAVGATP